MLWHLVLFHSPSCIPIQLFININSKYLEKSFQLFHHKYTPHCKTLQNAAQQQKHSRQADKVKWSHTYNGTSSSSCTLHTTFPRTTLLRLIPNCSFFRTIGSNLTVSFLAVQYPPPYGPSCLGSIDCNVTSNEGRKISDS